jgi:hypothetical protein
VSKIKQIGSYRGFTGNSLLMYWDDAIFEIASEENKNLTKKDFCPP